MVTNPPKRQVPRPKRSVSVIADRFLLAHRKRIVEFAATRRLPGMYPYREYVDAGGLMSYAPSNIELFRGAATYVDKVLKGAKPRRPPGPGAHQVRRGD
jgi:putative ABC transport system substrate-binding protein